MGPVQVLVVGLDRPTFSGEVLEEFDRLRDAGLVRLVDLLLVARADDGTLESMPLDGSPPDAGAVATALLTEGMARADADLAADGDQAWSLGAAVPPGSMAAVALIEHLWAEPLTAAIARAGGCPLDETWLGPDDRRALEALLQARAGARHEEEL
jgi:Family of unknown function (DUF6325)